MWRRIFWLMSLLSFFIVGLLAQLSLHALWLLFILVPLFLLGVYDILQSRRNVLRNYPLLGHFRYIFLKVRPEFRQYFFESNQDGMPFNNETRKLIYERAKKTVDTIPFGTQRDVYAVGFDSINHSLHPTKLTMDEAKVVIGNEQCSQPYHAYRLNISAMSFGALSAPAICALNRGAKLGGFAHNTGEGGLSPYHLSEGGDIIWQIGTGYFGCRNQDGTFNAELFQEKAHKPQVKMIEIKLSQGAKPAHGGILPAAKVSEEIAEIRGLSADEDCISPPAHSAFDSPLSLMNFITQLRELSGGKPVGFKLCIGQHHEFYAICKAMLQTKVYPDFITVDGAEGGTGAAPVEFTNYIGLPLREALSFVHNSLRGVGLRDKVKIIASGKVVTGFDMVRQLALGADLCNAARAMMFALGCIQSRRCNTNECPTGIATQDPKRYFAVDIADKAKRVYNFQQATLHSFLEVLGAAGIAHADDVKRYHILHRVGETDVKTYEELYPELAIGQLLGDNLPECAQGIWQMASAERF